MKRIVGLDSIRFVCATFVLFGHLGVPLLNYLPSSDKHSYFFYLRTLISLVFNGGAAVVVFFIISGFCIHFPFIRKQTIDLPSYYVRRLLRIGTPAAIAVFVYLMLHEDLKAPNFGVFWSIICEIVYYLLYPAFFYLQKYTKWKYIVAGSYICFFVYFFTHLTSIKAGNHDYPAFAAFNWLIGLPCWLLGCWLAENYSSFKALSRNKIWLFRFGMVMSGLILNIVKFHVHNIWGSNCITLNLFALIVCMWLGNEIMYLHDKKPSKLFEWSGKWSYSLYIIHPLAPTLLAFIGLNQYTNTNNPIAIVFAFAISYLFFLCIEKPSHKLSIFVSNLFSKNKSAKTGFVNKNEIVTNLPDIITSK